MGGRAVGGEPSEGGPVEGGPSKATTTRLCWDGTAADRRAVAFIGPAERDTPQMKDDPRQGGRRGPSYGSAPGGRAEPIRRCRTYVL